MGLARNVFGSFGFDFTLSAMIHPRSTYVLEQATAGECRSSAGFEEEEEEEQEQQEEEEEQKQDVRDHQKGGQVGEGLFG